MKKAVIYGAGNIGRGFIGQLFSESGYEVVFIDVNIEIVDQLNKRHEYPIEFASNEGNYEIIINNVRAINSKEQELVIDEISTADLMATAVGANILPKIAKNISEGIKLRWSKKISQPLDIIICENLLSADEYLLRLVMEYLDESEIRLLEKSIGFVEASIGRMVPVSTDLMREMDPLKAVVEAYDKLPVDRDGFKGEIPNIKGLIPYSPFDYYIQRKLYIHNLGHAITAYLGYQFGYIYIWEAINDRQIFDIVRDAMIESSAALSIEHNMNESVLIEHVDDLLQRFGNRQLGDTIERVGKDLIRKLSPEDRLIGALLLCKKHNIPHNNIELGIAAAIKYHEHSESEIIKYLEKNMTEIALQYICCLSPEDEAYSKILEIVQRGIVKA